MHVFLHFSVRYLYHRQKQQLTNVTKSDYEQAVPDIRHKAIFLLQQFFNSLSLKRLVLTVLAGKKKLIDALDHQFSPAAAGVHNRGIPTNAQ